MIEGSDGRLYGATENDVYPLVGTVYAVNKDGSGYNVLHHFPDSNPTDGKSPWGGIVEASDGTLYGTTLGGGDNGVGTVFKVNKDGTGFDTLVDLLGITDAKAFDQTFRDFALRLKSR